MVSELVSGMAKLQSAQIRFLWDAEEAEIKAQIKAAAEQVFAEANDESHEEVARQTAPTAIPSNVFFAPKVDR